MTKTHFKDQKSYLFFLQGFVANPTFQTVTKFGTARIQVSCPNGMNLLSCTVGPFMEVVLTGAKPLNSSTCECYSSSTVGCNARCTSNQVLGFQVVAANGSANFLATCPIEKKVLGCHIASASGYVPFSWQTYPLRNGPSCACYAAANVTCYATCATNVKDYEVVGDNQRDVVNGGYYSTCQKPGNEILGCGCSGEYIAKPSFCIYNKTSCYSSQLMVLGICGQFE